MSLRIIDRNIATIAKSMDKVNGTIHATGMMILRHAIGAGKGDVTRALALVQAMPKSMRRDAMVAWFHKYSPVRINLREGTVGLAAKHGELKNADAKLAAWKLDDADADPFYAAIADAKDAKAIAFDLAYAMKLLTQTLARVEKLANADGVNDNAKSEAVALVARIRKAEKIAA